jgi:hypothetical protein
MNEFETDKDLENDPDWNRYILFYRVYRHMSAILLLLFQMTTKRTFGKGWRAAYQYSKQNETGYEDD